MARDYTNNMIEETAQRYGLEDCSECGGWIPPEGSEAFDSEGTEDGSCGGRNGAWCGAFDAETCDQWLMEQERASLFDRVADRLRERVERMEADLDLDAYTASELYDAIDRRDAATLRNRAAGRADELPEGRLADALYRLAETAEAIEYAEDAELVGV